MTSSSVQTTTTTDPVEIPTYNCDMYDFTTSTKRGVQTCKGHKHREELQKEEKKNSLKVLVADEDREEEDISFLLANSTLEKDLVNLPMQDNGFSKLEMNTFDDTPLSKVVHPRLGIGTTPRARTQWKDQNKCALSRMDILSLKYFLTDLK